MATQLYQLKLRQEPVYTTPFCILHLCDQLCLSHLNPECYISQTDVTELAKTDSVSVDFEVFLQKNMNLSWRHPSVNILNLTKYPQSLPWAWGVQPYTGICCLVAGEACGFRLGLPSLPLCLPGNEALSLFTRILLRHAEMLGLWLVTVTVCGLESKSLSHCIFSVVRSNFNSCRMFLRLTK